MEAPIIIALDGMGREEALGLAETVAGRVWGFKVHELYLRHPDIIAALKPFGNVFLDLKFHDIPATVEKEVAAAIALGVDLVTVHAAGGEEMLRAAVAAGGNKVAAVTVLTSQLDTSAIEVLAERAADAGITNIVCSPHEIAIVSTIAPDALIITPGIRGADDPKDDQQRTMSAHDALAAGANLMVIGRPITKSLNPNQALEDIIQTLSTRSAAS